MTFAKIRQLYHEAVPNSMPREFKLMKGTHIFINENMVKSLVPYMEGAKHACFEGDMGKKIYHFYLENDPQPVFGYVENTGHTFGNSF